MGHGRGWEICVGENEGGVFSGGAVSKETQSDSCWMENQNKKNVAFRYDLCNNAKSNLNHLVEIVQGKEPEKI